MSSGLRLWGGRKDRYSKPEQSLSPRGSRCGSRAGRSPAGLGFRFGFGFDGVLVLVGGVHLLTRSNPSYVAVRATRVSASVHGWRELSVSVSTRKTDSYIWIGRPDAGVGRGGAGGAGRKGPGAHIPLPKVVFVSVFDFDFVLMSVFCLRPCSCSCLLSRRFFFSSE